jgi:hypothetical protein
VRASELDSRPSGILRVLRGNVGESDKAKKLALLQELRTAMPSHVASVDVPEFALAAITDTLDKT